MFGTDICWWKSRQTIRSTIRWCGSRSNSLGSGFITSSDWIRRSRRIPSPDGSRMPMRSAADGPQEKRRSMLKIIDVHASASAGGEYVVLQNEGLTTVNLRGWALCTQRYLNGDL